MEVIKTVVCQLKTTPEQAEALDETVKAFADACNFVLEKAKELKTANKFKLQQACYYELKMKFGLTANLAVRAIARVSDALKMGKVRRFRANSAVYDQRIFNFIEPKEMISLSTVKGRIKVQLAIGNYQRHLLKGQKPTHAYLVRRKKGFYINIVLSQPVPRPRPGENCQIVGVDLGLNNLATCSNGMKFPGGFAREVRERFQRLRSALQAKGTRGARKLLKQLSGKESRIIRWINHNISRRIVDSLNKGDVVVMEELTYIRERVKLRKEQRYTHNSWSFAQLQSFIEYKALEKGIAVLYTDPRNSSQTCPRCGQSGHRSSYIFSCSCGYRNHADFSASFELANRGRALLAGLFVSQPLISASS